MCVHVGYAHIFGSYINNSLNGGHFSARNCKSECRGSVRGFRELGANGQKQRGAGGMGVKKTGSREIMKRNLGVI